MFRLCRRESGVPLGLSQHLDLSVPSATELMMMYTSSRQIPVCDVAACRYAFGSLQSSLWSSGTSGALRSTAILLHIITWSGQTFQTASAALLYVTLLWNDWRVCFTIMQRRTLLTCWRYCLCAVCIYMHICMYVCMYLWGQNKGETMITWCFNCAHLINLIPNIH